MSRLSPLRRVVGWLMPWILFHVFLLWGWRVSNPFKHLPAVWGDLLTVIWKFEWCEQVLLFRQSNPLSYSLFAHPTGMHAGGQNFGPIWCVLSLPLERIGGVVFAYNVLTLLSLYVCFAGAFLSMRCCGSRWGATLGALGYTFLSFRWVRVGTPIAARELSGHLNILWMSSLIPWMMWFLERAKGASRQGSRGWIVSGILWGIMLNLSPYAALIGGLLTAIYLPSLKARRAVILTGLALIGGAPSLLLQAIATRQDQLVYFDILHLSHWGSSLNALPIPSIYHPWEPVRRLARALYTGPGDESGIFNLGFTLTFLFALGLIRSLRPSWTGLSLATPALPKEWILLALIGVTLSVGPYLKWNGVPLAFEHLQTVHIMLWRLGYHWKPQVFLFPEPPEAARSWIPMPALVLVAIVPFLEGARVFARIWMVSALGWISVALRTWEGLPFVWRGLIALLWLIELLPTPTQSHPLPPLHPAYEWLANHELPEGEGIIELRGRDLFFGPETGYAAWRHRKPTVSPPEVSTVPAHIAHLRHFLWNHSFKDPRLSEIFDSFRVRYIFFHIKEHSQTALWEELLQNPGIQRIGCFEPLPSPGPWEYPICVAERIGETRWRDLALLEGWSASEPWGIWAEGVQSIALWFAPRVIMYQLRLEAFPYCSSDKKQHMEILINDRLLATTEWTACESQRLDLLIPTSVIRRGMNTLTFRYAYAIRPVEHTGGRNPDPRPLSVGFTRLEIIASAP